MSEIRRLITLFYERMWNSWDTGIIPEILSENIEFRGSIGLAKKGHEEMIGYIRIIRNAFPDFHNRIDEIIVEESKAAVKLTYTGTHKGELFGIKPTDRKIEYCGIAIFKIEENRISNVFVLGDLHNLLNQLTQSD